MTINTQYTYRTLSHGKTSSSAVAKRPRVASYLSVVSFNSTKRRAESFIVRYVGLSTELSLRAVINALFCCLWRNVRGFLS